MRGIKYIEHLYDFRRHRFYDFEQFRNLYDLHPSEFLNYHALISCIPTNWKDELKNIDMHTITQPLTNNLLLDRILRIKKPNRLLYENYINKHKGQKVNKPEVKWENEFMLLEWKSIYLNCFYCTIENRLRSFQYKYIKRILPVNKMLFKYKLANSNLCGFCNMYIEDINHLYWECSKVQHFWSKLKVFLDRNNIQTEITFKNISFGIIEKQTPRVMLINFIFLLSKFYIHKCKLINDIPAFESFVIYLKQRKQIERCLAESKGKIQLHDLKWNQININ